MALACVLDASAAFVDQFREGANTLWNLQQAARLADPDPQQQLAERVLT